MSKWFKKFVNGNPDKEDFTSKDLPKTRFDQFIDVIKLRFGGLATVNLLVFLFAIPVMAWLMYNWIMYSQVETMNSSITETQVIATFLLGAIPLYTITGPAMAGMYYCIRNWIWNRRATVGEDFWKEFKRSWKQALLFNFVDAALLYAGCFWVVLCYENAAQYPVLQFVAIAIIVLLCFYYMSSIYHYPQLVTYNLKVLQIYKNSFIYMIAQLPRTLAASVIYVLLIALCVFLGEILLVIAMTLGYSFVCLGNMILADFLFDKYVNAPEDQRKGMAPKN